MFGAQRDARQRLDRVARLELQPPMLHDGRQQDHRFLHRKAHADADARTGAERQIGETVDLLPRARRETLGIEIVRLVP